VTAASEDSYEGAHVDALLRTGVQKEEPPVACRRLLYISFDELD